MSTEVPPDTPPEGEEEELFTEEAAFVPDPKSEESADRAAAPERSITTICNEAAQGALSSLKDWRAEGGGIFTTVNKWKTDGTPLREVFKNTRIELNSRLQGTFQTYATVQESIQMKLDTAKAHSQAALGTIGVEYTSMVDLRRKHPALLVGGTTVAVAIPSILGGKAALLRNGIMACAASAGVVYGLNWWDERSSRK